MENNAKDRIKHLLKSVLRNKFKSHNPETFNMPFHTRLLGKDKMALYNFIHSLNTNFGMTIFEPVACDIGKTLFTVKKQVSVGNIITRKAERVIQNIMNKLESGSAKPDRITEVEAVMDVAYDGETSEIKPAKVDLFLQRENDVYLIDIKTAKPNRGGFKELKRTLLTWVAAYAYKNEGVNIHSMIGIPYNPYEPKPYQRWTMAGMIDVKDELKVADEFWDFIGGHGSYNLLLEVFEEVGIEMKVEIDDYFAKIR